MAGYTNFDRQYRMAAGQAGAEAFEVGEVSAAYRVPLHIKFSLEKTDLETQNTGKIEIWNLNDEHIAELEKAGCIVSLKAGYGSTMSLIFAGFVTYVSTVWDNADRKTTIEVLDSLVETKDTYLSVSYEGEVSWETIFNDAAAQIGCVVVFSYNAEFVTLANGYSYIGPAQDLFDKGCECCGLSWSIQNGIVQIKMPGDSMSQQVFTISAATGMIGSPEKVVITSDDSLEENTVGYDVTYFLNGAIDVNDYVMLESEVITGYFYVYSLKIEGDNIDGDWTCTARLLQLVQS